MKRAQSGESEVARRSPTYVTRCEVCSGDYRRRAEWARALRGAHLALAVVRSVAADGLCVSFENASGAGVDLVWSDYDGEEVPLARMPPGDLKRFSVSVEHKFLCRHSDTNQLFLLNQDYLLSCRRLLGRTKTLAVRVRRPPAPPPLADLARLSLVRRLSSDKDILRLPAPPDVKLALRLDKWRMIHKEYYSVGGEPGEYRKSYGGREGPLLYPPGLDWSAVDELGGGQDWW